MNLKDRLDPIVAIATAPGRAAVGIVRISGNNLRSLSQVLTGKHLQPRVAHFTSFLDDKGQSIDRGIAIFFPAPSSYTGEDVLELQAHGGPVVLQELIARCLSAAQEIEIDSKSPVLADLRVARPGEFTERAFLNGKLDLAQAEAVCDLIDASSATAARFAARSAEGVFSEHIKHLQSGLINLRALVEASLDFVDQDIEELSRDQAQKAIVPLMQQLKALGARSHQGALLSQGIKVVIAGQPNAGKSSLLNALAGLDLAIVSERAGTTRDALGQSLQIQGVPLHVVDTAGLRHALELQSADPIERIGIERAWIQILGADAILFLHDLTRVKDGAYCQADQAIERQLREKLQSKVALIHVWNKCDACTVEDKRSAAASDVVISARTREGMDALENALLTLVGWQAPVGEDVFIARQRHVQALAKCQLHLSNADELLLLHPCMFELIAEELRLAQYALGTITGEFGVEDLLGEIFSRFCMGK